MKNYFLVLVSFLFAFSTAKAQDIYLTPTASIGFFSATSMENIDAKTKEATAAINVKTKKIFFKVKNTSFHFKSSLMEEHFNENYMESEKFPFTQFNGEIVDAPNQDFTKDGNYDVTVKGKMTLHGVEKEYTTKGSIVVKDGKLKAQAKFNIRIEDHKIKIPSLVGANIAEQVEVTVDGTFEAQKK